MPSSGANSDGAVGKDRKKRLTMPLLFNKKRTSQNSANDLPVDPWQQPLQKTPSKTPTTASTSATTATSRTAESRRSSSRSHSATPRVGVRSFTPIDMNGFMSPSAYIENETSAKAVFKNTMPHREDSPVSSPSANTESHATLRHPRPITAVNNISNRLSSGEFDSILRSPSPLGGRGSTANGDGNSPWIGAVGGATTTGKTGRVVEKLMADIDRLRRDLNLEVQKRQDLERREEASRSTIDVLRNENDNLQQAKEVDAAVLRRRDRQVEELRTDLNTERERRSRAEHVAREANVQKDNALVEYQKEISKANDIAKHSSSHADVLEQSHRQLNGEYRQRIETIKKEMSKIVEEREQERQTNKRLEVVMEQQSQELERAQRMNKSLSANLEIYRQESLVILEDVLDRTKAQHQVSSTLFKEGEKAIGDARRMVNISRNTIERVEAGKQNLDGTPVATSVKH